MDIGEHPGCNRGETYLYTNADSVRMYKNDRFIKEYRREDSPYKNMLHGPLLIDDYIGNAIAEWEDFAPGQEKGIKEALNAAARFGLSNLPKSIYLTALKLMLVYHMKPDDAVGLYNKYVGDWGGTSTKYRFEAIKDSVVVKVITKEPMHQAHLVVETDHQNMVEKSTYDVAALRITVRDENENILPFFSEPVMVETEGPVEVIGPLNFSLKGGMGGTYIKTTGVEGNATVTLKCGQTEIVQIEFSCQIKNM
jgi:beta-galactosidase